jgi:hypothetical protein
MDEGGEEMDTKREKQQSFVIMFFHKSNRVIHFALLSRHSASNRDSGLRPFLRISEKEGAVLDFPFPPISATDGSL